MKAINFIIVMDIYPFDVMVSIGESDLQLAKSLKPYESALDREDYALCRYASPTATGRAVMFSTNASLLRLRKLPKSSKDFGYLAHEVFHIASFILDRIGTKLVIMVSDESYAYLIQFLTTKIYEEVNKYY